MASQQDDHFFASRISQGLHLQASSKSHETILARFITCRLHSGSNLDPSKRLVFPKQGSSMSALEHPCQVQVPHTPGVNATKAMRTKIFECKVMESKHVGLAKGFIRIDAS